MTSAQPDISPAAARPRPGWTGGRITCLVLGALLGLFSIGLIAGGGSLLWVDQAQRQDGYLTVTTPMLSTSGYALTSGAAQLHGGAADWAASALGTIRIRVTPADPARNVFVGIARPGATGSYLAGVPYATVTGIAAHQAAYTLHAGTARPASPQGQRIWAAQARGPGTQSLTWPARSGTWTVVLMNADSSAGVTATAEIGATVPALTWFAVGFLAGGAILLAVAVVLVVLPVRRASAGQAG